MNPATMTDQTPRGRALMKDADTIVRRLHTESLGIGLGQARIENPRGHAEYDNILNKWGGVLPKAPVPVSAGLNNQ